MSTKTRTIVAEEYGMCRKTLRKRMDAMPYEFPKTSLDPRWLKLIYEEMGYPESVDEDDYVKVRVPPSF
jgi:hypothetical protein